MIFSAAIRLFPLCDYFRMRGGFFSNEIVKLTITEPLLNILLEGRKYLLLGFRENLLNLCYNLLYFS